MRKIRNRESLIQYIFLWVFFLRVRLIKTLVNTQKLHPQVEKLKSICTRLCRFSLQLLFIEIAKLM